MKKLLFLFTAIVMGFNNPAEPQQVTYGTPESHVWEVYLREGTTGWLLNKVTGEVKGLQASNESIFIPKVKDKR